MSHSDIILTVVGVALILAGAVLFISGKQAGGKNKIEALGIKMDVSNPSLVLIVFGILLLLAPRMMPDNGNGQTPDMPSATDHSDPHPLTKTSEGTQTPVKSLPAASAKTKPRAHSRPALQGNYDLVTYVENGVAINAEGQLSISPAEGDIFPFTGRVQAYIDWATTVNLQYEGYIAHRGNKWFLKVNSASDPEWVDRGEVSMKLVRDDDSISMKYYYDADIFLLWER